MIGEDFTESLAACSANMSPISARSMERQCSVACRPELMPGVEATLRVGLVVGQVMLR